MRSISQIVCLLGAWFMLCVGFALGQPLLLFSGSGGGGGVGAAYNAVGVNFDGTNTYLARNGALTGAPTAAKTGIYSFWFRMRGNDSNALVSVEDSSAGNLSGLFYQVLRQGNNTVRVNENNLNTVSLSTNSTFINGMAWAHVLAAWDVTIPRLQMYVNNVAEGTLTSGNNATNIASATDWGIGGRIVSAPSLLWNGDMADLYVNLSETMDISVAANRGKFINQSTLKPVSPGNTCNLPTGNSPIICLGGPAFVGSAGNWTINHGTGGNFNSQGNGLTLSSAPGPSG